MSSDGGDFSDNEDFESTEKFPKSQISLDKINEMKDVFNQMELGSHLASITCGNKSETEIKTIYGRISRFILWCNDRLKPVKESNIAEVSIFLVKWTLFQIIKKHNSLINDYCSKYLTETEELKPFTVVNHLLDIKLVARWYVFFRTDFDKDLKCKKGCFAGLEQYISAISRSYKKNGKRKRTKKSMKLAIEEGRLPSGGMIELQEAIIKMVPTLKQICVQPVINKSTYDFFMGCLFGSMYAFSPQGRIGGFEGLIYGQASGLITDGYAMVKDFKTSLTYGAQPITVRSIALDVLKMYHDKIRVKVTELVKLFTRIFNFKMSLTKTSGVRRRIW